jgi:hypothetical protein
MSYTRNSDPNYYNKHHTNCGSFALSIKEWYSPDYNFVDEYGDVEEWMDEVVREYDCDDYNLSNLFAYKLLNIITEDFPDLRFVNSYSVEQLKPDEELIAFRTSCMAGETWDFHFKVYRDGRWQEKMGKSPVCDCEENNWTNGWFEYISDTFYFVRKINDYNR